MQYSHTAQIIILDSMRALRTCSDYSADLKLVICNYRFTSIFFNHLTLIAIGK